MINLVESNSVILRVYPVCECGNVIKDLTVKNNIITPNRCPVCNKIIESIELRYPFDYKSIDFNYD